MYKITQDLTDLRSLKIDGKSFETLQREKATHLRKYMIDNKDKLIKRKLKCKFRTQSRQTLYIHGAPIYIMDEAWNLMKRTS